MIKRKTIKKKLELNGKTLLLEAKAPNARKGLRMFPKLVALFPSETATQLFLHVGNKMKEQEGKTEEKAKKAISELLELFMSNPQIAITGFQETAMQLEDSEGGLDVTIEMLLDCFDVKVIQYGDDEEESYLKDSWENYFGFNDLPALLKVVGWTIQTFFFPSLKGKLSQSGQTQKANSQPNPENHPKESLEKKD